MTPGDLYRTCRVSAYRLETRQHYMVPDDAARQRAFHPGAPLPPPRQSKLDDLRLISELRAAGRLVGRVHIIDRPLSDYVRYELAAYAENVDAGEDVRLADRSSHPELAGLMTDFAIFDPATDSANLILFDYDAEGRLLGYEHTQDPDQIRRYWQQYQLALDYSVPLSMFAAGQSQTGS